MHWIRRTHLYFGIFLFPWAVALKGLGAFGFWSMIAFLGVLTVGFVYEWCKGALDWE